MHCTTLHYTTRMNQSIHPSIHPRITPLHITTRTTLLFERTKPTGSFPHHQDSSKRLHTPTLSWSLSYPLTHPAPVSWQNNENYDSNCQCTYIEISQLINQPINQRTNQPNRNPEANPACTHTWTKSWILVSSHQFAGATQNESIVHNHHHHNTIILLRREETTSNDLPKKIKNNNTTIPNTDNQDAHPANRDRNQCTVPTHARPNNQFPSTPAATGLTPTPTSRATNQITRQRERIARIHPVMHDCMLCTATHRNTAHRNALLDCIRHAWNESRSIHASIHPRAILFPGDPTGEERSLDRVELGMYSGQQQVHGCIRTVV